MITQNLIKKKTVLYVDDEKQNLESFCFCLQDEFDIITEESPIKALEIIRKKEINVIITDQRMPDLTGLEFIKLAKQILPNSIFIVITAYTDIEVILEAMNSLKIFQYVQKPVDMNELKIILNNAFETHFQVMENKRLMNVLLDKNNELEKLNERLREQNLYLLESHGTNNKSEQIISKNKQVKALLNDIKIIAKSGAPVLIQGESGTGKELVAEAIHELSCRHNGNLIKVNCPALSESLFESELFGHERGAFTGALKRKLGRFELAEEGTLFLDEIGDLPLQLQPKLLRVIQQGEFERVGGEKTIKTNVRIIAATNHNLFESVQQQTFREDLFYRLNVFPVLLPPLRERLDDIPLLADQFIEKFSKQYRKKVLKLSKETLNQLLKYSWPGNVRELENVMERAVLLGNLNTIKLSNSPSNAGIFINNKYLDEVIRNHIISVLEQVNWRIHGDGGAAEVLGLKPTTLKSKMDKLNIFKKVNN